MLDTTLGMELRSGGTLLLIPIDLVCEKPSFQLRAVYTVPRRHLPPSRQNVQDCCCTDQGVFGEDYIKSLGCSIVMNVRGRNQAFHVSNTCLRFKHESFKVLYMMYVPSLG